MPKSPLPPLAVPRQRAKPAQKAAIAKVASKKEAGAIVSEMARESLTPARWNQNVKEEHLELVLARISAGSTLRAVCLELGIASAQVLQRFYDDPDFAVRMRKAREAQGFAMLDMTVEVAWNDEESVERSKLKVQVLDRIARTFNRDLSERQQVDIRTLNAYVLPPEADDF